MQGYCLLATVIVTTGTLLPCPVTVTSCLSGKWLGEREIDGAKDR
jgi:hypothetical protein